MKSLTTTGPGRLTLIIQESFKGLLWQTDEIAQIEAFNQGLHC